MSSPAESEFDTAACLARLRRPELPLDEGAARELMQHLYPQVLRLVRSHLPRRTAEEDLCQVVFVKIFQRLDQYSGSVPLEHWVSRVTVNTCLHELAAEKVRPEVRWSELGENEARTIELLAAESNELPTDRQLAARELTERLLTHLAPADRLLMHWLHLEERTVAEIAQLTGWSRPLVKVRAFRARQKLKRVFAHLSNHEKP